MADFTSTPSPELLQLSKSLVFGPYTERDSSGNLIGATGPYKDPVSLSLDPTGNTLATEAQRTAYFSGKPLPTAGFAGRSLIGDIPDFEDMARKDIDTARADIDLRRKQVLGALENIYETEFGRQLQTQRERAARQRVMNVRTGAEGSEIGEAKVRGLEQLSTEERQTLTQKKALAVAQVMGQFSQEESARIEQVERSLAAREKRFFDRQEFFTNRAKETVTALSQSGADFETIRRDPNYGNLLDVFGSDTAVKGYYLAAKPKSEIVHKEMLDGKAIFFSRKPDGTIEKIEMELPVNPQDDVDIHDGYMVVTKWEGTPKKSRMVSREVIDFDPEKRRLERRKAEADIQASEALAAERYASAAAKKMEKGQLNAQQQRNLLALRREFNGRPEVKDYREMGRYVANIDTAMKEAKTTNSFVAVDQTLINAFNKLNDPTSVVRESEYARTGNDIAFLNRLRGKWEKVLVGGAGLTIEEREAIARMAKNFYAAAKTRYEQAAAGTIVTGESLGVADAFEAGIKAEDEFIIQGGREQAPDIEFLKGALQPGEILVQDKNGNIGAIPEAEFDPNLYTKFEDIQFSLP